MYKLLWSNRGWGFRSLILLAIVGLCLFAFYFKTAYNPIYNYITVWSHPGSAYVVLQATPTKGARSNFEATLSRVKSYDPATCTLVLDDAQQMTNDHQVFMFGKFDNRRVQSVLTTAQTEYNVHLMSQQARKQGVVGNCPKSPIIYAWSSGHYLELPFTAGGLAPNVVDVSRKGRWTGYSYIFPRPLSWPVFLLVMLFLIYKSPTIYRWHQKRKASKENAQAS